MNISHISEYSLLTNDREASAQILEGLTHQGTQGIMIGLVFQENRKEANEGNHMNNLKTILDHFFGPIQSLIFPMGNFPSISPMEELQFIEKLYKKKIQ